MSIRLVILALALGVSTTASAFSAEDRLVAPENTNSPSVKQMIGPAAQFPTYGQSMTQGGDTQAGPRAPSDQNENTCSPGQDRADCWNILNK